MLWPQPHWLWQVMWIRIRNGSVFRSFLDPDPHMLILHKIEAKCERFKIKIHNSDTKLTQNFVGWHFVLIVLKIIFFTENNFSIQLFFLFYFKINSLTLDPNWVKTPWSGFKNVFGSTTLVVTDLGTTSPL